MRLLKDIHNKKTIFLTGSRGFIGRNIQEALSSKYTILAPDHQELELTDTVSVDEYFLSNEIDIVIHCASIGGKRSNLYMPDSVEKNLKMFFNLVRNRKYFKKMIHLGSGAEYDKSRSIIDIKEEEFGESIPKDQYGFYKYICSRYIMYDPKIVVLRLFGVFGKYEDYTTRFISNNFCRAICGLPIIVNKNAYFDYLYINDLIKIVDYFVLNKTHQRIFNVGSGKKIALTTLVDKIKKITSSSHEIVVKKRGYGNEYTCDIKRLKKEIKNFEYTNLNNALQDLYRYYLDNKNKIFTKNFID